MCCFSFLLTTVADRQPGCHSHSNQNNYIRVHQDCFHKICYLPFIFHFFYWIRCPFLLHLCSIFFSLYIIQVILYATCRIEHMQNVLYMLYILSFFIHFGLIRWHINRAFGNNRICTQIHVCLPESSKRNVKKKRVILNSKTLNNMQYALGKRMAEYGVARRPQ